MPVVPPFKNLMINETLKDSFPVAIAILQYQRVKLDANGAIVPGVLAADLCIGTAVQNQAVGDIATILLDLPQQYGRSNTLIEVGAPVYTAAGGLVTGAAGGTLLGVAKIGAPVPGVLTGNKQAAVIICGVRVSA